MPQIREQIAMVHLPPSKTLKYLFHVRKTKETNKSKKLVCLFFIPRIIKYYVFWSDFNRKSLRFYV